MHAVDQERGDPVCDQANRQVKLTFLKNKLFYFG